MILNTYQLDSINNLNTITALYKQQESTVPKSSLSL